MPQNEQHTTNDTPTTRESSVDSKRASTPKVVLGSLNKALVRTFRGDLSRSLNNNEEEIQKYLPAEQVPDSATPTPAAAPEKVTPRDAVVHTFSDDVQHLVRNKKMSMVRAAALESDKARTSEEAVTTGPWRTVILVLLVILGIIALAVIAAGGYYAYRLNAGTPSTYELNPGLLFTEGRERIEIGDISTQKTNALFAALRGSSYFSLGALTEFYITQTPPPQSIGETATPVHLDASEFLKRLAARVPDSFLQTLGAAYMVGVYTTDDGNMPFMVFTTSSYSYAFNGLLEWEAYMAHDLRYSFVSPNEKPRSSGFVDEVYDNIDVRVLYNALDKPMLMYGFVDRSTFVITTDKRTLLEVISRARVAKP